ncbi:CinA family protein [bacterium]|nr:CinA family protein [bacterium]
MFLLAEALVVRGWSLSVAESLTGGELSARLSSTPGASAWFRGGIVSYQVGVKSSLLGVHPKVIKEQGVVSEAVATGMAKGVSTALGTEIALALTGVAGPGPQDGLPAGTVWMALYVAGKTNAVKWILDGDRESVRRASVEKSIESLSTVVLPTR